VRSGVVATCDRIIETVRDPSVALTLGLALALILTDQVLVRIHAGAMVEGPFDEIAHLLTGALVLAALRGVSTRSFAIGLLAASVLIDLDHVPGSLGLDWITNGTDRPYTHSVVVIAIAGLAAVRWCERSALLTGVVIGLAMHLFRDLAESSSGVALAWPWSSYSSTLPHWSYLLAMGVILTVALWRSLRPGRAHVTDMPSSINSARVRNAVAAGLVLALVVLASSSSASAGATTLGVYVGPNSPALVSLYESWLGRPVGRVLDYLGDESWSKIERPSWFVNGWGASAWRDRMIYSVPMLPATGGSIQIGGRGGYDEHFRVLAQTLIDAGQGDVVIRPGWEANGDWYRWSGAGDPGAFVAYFRHIVTAMRGVSGARFRFDWSVSMGSASVPASAIYPGDAYVDYIGLDVYDQYWGADAGDPRVRWRAYLARPYGLRWHRAFAASHGKPMTYSEWGIIERPDGHGGGDDPYFVDRMSDWISINNVAYAIYFEHRSPSGSSALSAGRFPASAEAMRRDFGTPRP